MEKTPAAARGERRFLLVSTAVLALVCAAAFWFAPPFGGAPGPAAVPPPLEQAAWVDVNHAGVEALSTLPGIGEQKARAIIEYRTQHGAFASVLEVAQVSGITEQTVRGWGSLAYAG